MNKNQQNGEFLSKFFLNVGFHILTVIKTEYYMMMLFRENDDILSWIKIFLFKKRCYTYILPL